MITDPAHFSRPEWWLENWGERVLVVLRHHVRADEREREFLITEPQVDAWLTHGPHSWKFRELLEAVYGVSLFQTRWVELFEVDRATRYYIIRALFRFQLAAIHTWSPDKALGLGSADAPTTSARDVIDAARARQKDREANEAARQANRSNNKTWVEIQLIDDQGKPVPNAKYKIKLPDGSTQEGTTDSQGLARFDNIDPGNCDVSFPEIHKNEWKPA